MKIVVSSEACTEVAVVCQNRVGLEGVLVSIWETAWAVAVAVDLEVGHLGDGNPRESGVHMNPERVLELYAKRRDLL